MTSILYSAFKKMWKLSAILVVIGVYKWQSNNPMPSSFEELVRPVLGLLILMFGLPLLVALVLYLDEKKLSIKRLKGKPRGKNPQ